MNKTPRNTLYAKDIHEFVWKKQWRTIFGLYFTVEEHSTTHSYTTPRYIAISHPTENTDNKRYTGCPRSNLK